MREVLTIGGYLFGGPVGALVGGFLADIFFPLPGIKGPRLNELNFQRSTVGAPVPIVYGTVALAGNVIWSSGLIETKHEDEQGGLFGLGGQEVTTYTYAVDIAIGICEGPIGGIRRIWADADLIYDASDDATIQERFFDAFDDIAAALLGIRAASEQLDFTFYTGTDDQLPDPTIQAYENIPYAYNVVPAYRGLAYIVLQNFQLEKFGNRIPNFRFEVFSNGAENPCGLYSVGQLFPWWFEVDFEPYDPRNPDNTHIYRANWTGTDPGMTLDEARAALATAYGRPFFVGNQPQSGESEYVHGWAASGGSNEIAPCNMTGEGAPLDYVRVHMSVNSLEIQEKYCTLGNTSITCDQIEGFYGYQHVAHIISGQHSGFWVYTLDGDTTTAVEYFDGYPADAGGDTCASPGGKTRALLDRKIGVERTIQPPDRWNLTWTPVSGTFKALQVYTAVGNLVTKYPVNPTLALGDVGYSDQDYWEGAYADALAAGEVIAGGLIYGVDYPVTTSSAWQASCTSVTVACVQMADIVSDICRRSGLRTDTSTQIDVSDITTCVPGYVIGRQMTGRDALGPLRMYGLWDAVESDALLKFIERGHAIVETLTADDLGVHENGGQAPSLVEVSRVQEKDLPRRLRLHFANFLHDHEVSEQSASRITTEAVTELDVDLPISMEPDTAIQLADIMLYAEWVGRNTYRFSLDNSRLALEPTDCVEIPVDGQTERVRILAINYSIGGIVQVDAQRDDDGAYISELVATPGTPSGGAPGGPGSALICPSHVVLLDLPRLNNAHIDAGYYAAIYGEPNCESWACAELYRSSDGGVTFGRVARTNDETSVGEILAITGPDTDPTLPGDSPPYDTSNSITVELFDGTLSSITDAQIDAGQNMAAVGVDGSWVIIQFKTAVLDTGDTWVLSDLIWGLNDTQHLLGTTGVGDTFVLLSDAALIRIAESADAIGQSKEFKVVTCGQAIDDADEISFTTWGLSYLRPCPSTVISASVTDPPVGADDGDAYLLPNDTSLSGVWAEHGGQIAKWSDETDSWVYCTPAPGTIIHIEGDTSTDGDDVISGGDGTTTPAPWTPAIPPLAEAMPDDTDYLVFYDGTTYKKTQVSNVGGGGGFDTSDTSDIGISLDALTDVVITAPTTGDVLVYDGAQWVNTPADSVGQGAMVFVGQAAVVGSAVTTLTLSGLDLDTDECYFISLETDNPSGSVCGYSVYYNADTTATNYYTEIYAASGSTNFPSRVNNALIRNVGVGAPASIYGYIRRGVEGTIRFIGNNGTHATTSLDTGVHTHAWNTASTNVTGITITASVASGISIGSVLKVWKLLTTGVGAVQFVGSTTVVGSNATTMTVSGLNLDADLRYLITIEIDNTSGGATGIRMYFNSDTTGTNYDNQAAQFSSTTAAPVRSNNAELITLATGQPMSLNGLLSLNVEGSPRFVSGFGIEKTTTLQAYLSTLAWRTAGTNVTGVTISSSVASGLGIGSSIKIWRLA